MPEYAVVIVGGGAAGLAAAVALEQFGLSCLVVEAQSRLGGRVHTVSRTSDVLFERGAQMINGDMSAVLDLAAEAGLHLSPIPSTGRDLCLVDGAVYPRSDLIAAEEAEALLADAIRSWSSAREILGSLWSSYRWWTEPWESPGEVRRGVALATSRSDQPKDSVGAAIRRLLLCPEDEAIVRTIVAEQFGADPDEMSAHAVKKASAAYASARSDLEFQFPAGMARIIETLAQKLSRPPLLNAPVKTISADRDGVRITTAKQEILARRVILAVPPNVACTIDIRCDDAAALKRLLSAFSAGDMIKTTLVYDRAFWRENGCSGSVTFAAPIGLEVRDTSYDLGQKPRLTAFLGGPMARARARLSQEDRNNLLLEELRAVFGDSAGRPTDFDEGIWVDHPWSGGGYNAYVRCGHPADVAERLAAWSGPIQFAGAELDTGFAGYVEGALRSGRRVAARIANDLASDRGALCA